MNNLSILPIKGHPCTIVIYQVLWMKYSVEEKFSPLFTPYQVCLCYLFMSHWYQKGIEVRLCIQLLHNEYCWWKTSDLWKRILTTSVE